MRKWFKTYNHVLFALAWFMVGILFMVAIGASSSKQENTMCSGVEVMIDHETGNQFVDEGDVKQLMAVQLPNKDFDLPIKFIPLQELEDTLERNPYIENAELYIDINGKLWAEVWQKYPLVRVINSENQAYYISREGEKMPISLDFTARVPVASGSIFDNGRIDGMIQAPITQSLYLLSQYIDQHDFWKSQVEQIYVEDNGDILIIPKVGDHEIVFGRLESLQDIERKFDLLMAFYKDGLASVGWDTYKEINLKYKNQIVCTKK